MGRAFFVTGTDTGVGKTTAACAILSAARAQKMSTAAIKPVAAGCVNTADGLRNDDALRLQKTCTQELTYQQINPIALAPAVAPHIAADHVGQRLDAKEIVNYCRTVLEFDADLTLIEGAGGWRVPLNEDETFSDLAVALDVPVILVVDIKLGCLNHAMLTAEAIRNDGLALKAWVANQTIGRDNNHRQMVETLNTRLNCTMLGDLPNMIGVDIETLASFIDIAPLMLSADDVSN
jgi:dethiobiotin synthetase